MIYFIVRFIIIGIILEKEMYKNPNGLIGGALARCNSIERFVFYAFPFISDIYVLFLIFEHNYPNSLPKIDWKTFPKGGIF